MIDLISELKRMQSIDNNETFDRTTDSLEAIRNFLGTVTTGLIFKGTVSTYTGVNDFESIELAGWGNTAFEGWYVYDFWDVGGLGAAPQGEARIITGYVSLTGGFTHAAFTAPLVLGSEVFIIHPWLYGALMAANAGTYAHPNGVAEQIAITITPVYPVKANTIYLDLVNLTENCTIRVKVEIDGATPRTIETFNWTTGMDDGVYFRQIASDVEITVTIQSLVAEGAVRDIPYRYFTED